MFQNPFNATSNFFLVKKIICVGSFLFFTLLVVAQNPLQWQNVSIEFGPLPETVQVFKTSDSVEGQPNMAYYVKAKLKDKNLLFTTDTTYQRRLTPQQFYTKNNQPLVVVNTTFFSFTTHQNLNVVVKEGRTVAYNQERNVYSEKDSTRKLKVYHSAIGISKKGNADVAWVKTDSTKNSVFATQGPIYLGNFFAKRGSVILGTIDTDNYQKWKMQTAVGGGPVLLQNGAIKITNEEERKFYGKAFNDKHPRTAMGYTADGYLIILAIQGRFPGLAEGASLLQTAQMLKGLGCVEALNLDGGGSSCLLVNGKETISPSDKTQRAIPAVFIIDDK